MRISGLSRYALTSCVAAAMLTACGGSQPPIGAAGAMAQRLAIATQADRGTSWMRPEAKSDDLLYVSDSSSKVYVYSYPKGDLVGTLTGFDGPTGECRDAAGDVWITDLESNEIVEYAHGGTQPIATLTDSGYPVGCSVEPTTGDLAVVNDDPGTVEVYPDAQGTPATYSSADFPDYYYCTYDSLGNLFADGGDSHGMIAELPYGGSKLETIALNEDLVTLSMQWDGSYLSVVGRPYGGPLRVDRRAFDAPRGGDLGPVQVYRVSVSGSAGTVVSKALLKSPRGKHENYAVQYWITGNTIIGPDRYRYGLAVVSWRYPKGGWPSHAIRTKLGGPVGYGSQPRAEQAKPLILRSWKRGAMQMKSLGFSSAALSIYAVTAMLAGCGGSQPPIGAPGRNAAELRDLQHTKRSGSWMLPEAKSEDLLYVFTDRSSIYVFSYPKGKLVGNLTGFSGIYGECVDGAGDVWVTNFSPPEIIEYAHGGSSPKATLSDAGAEPGGCSIDPTTGNLAVANYYPANVAVYEDAQGYPTTYSDPDFGNYDFCTYDSSGNLFADDHKVAGEIAELNAGGSKLETVSLSEQLFPVSMQWDGAYLAIVDRRGVPRGPTPVARVQVTASGGEIVSTTQLDSPHDRRASTGVQYFVDGGTIVGPDRYRHAGDRLALLFWHYPSGGKPFKVIRGTWSAGGAVVSAAPK